MGELLVLLRADLAGVRNRLARGRWGERLGSLGAVAVAVLFAAGCHLFLVRVLGGIRRLEGLESLLPEAVLLLTGQLLAMVALTAFASLLASALLTAVAATLQARDLASLLAAPLAPLPLFGHRLLRTAVGAGMPIMLLLVPTATALGVVWGRPLAVLAVALVSGALLVVACAGAAVAVLLALVVVFPARRVTQLAASLSALTIAAVIGALRAVRPERLFNPADGYALVTALRSIELPSLESYPSTWMAGSWLAVASGGEWWGQIVRLVLVAAVSVTAAGAAFAVWHRRAWIRTREAPPPALPGLGVTRRVGAWLADRLPAPMAAVARQELLVLTRDPGQWTQLALLAGLVALYLYNLTLIPGDTAIVGPLLALLNVGIAGLVLAAVAVRLALPSVSRDGPSRWLAEVAPLPAHRRLVAKTVVVSAALVLLGGGLTAAAAALLTAPMAFKLQAIAAVLLMGPTMAAVAVGAGARFPRYDLADPVQVAVSAPGLLCFAALLAYVAASTVLTARPVLGFYLRMVGASRGVVLVTPWLAAAAHLALSLVLGLGALGWGARRLELPRR